MSVTEEAVKAALATVVDTNTGKDLVSSRAVRNLAVSGDVVRFDDELGYPARSQIGELRERVTQAYSEREDIIVISDEAHRTQYGRLALNMRKGLPRAKFLGFTGTPFSERKVCSSPDWNISRVMSQPPTNSPFT